MKNQVTQMSATKTAVPKMMPYADFVTVPVLAEFTQTNPISTNRRSIALRTGADR